MDGYMNSIKNLIQWKQIWRYFSFAFSIVKCAFGKDGRALYFSRSPIPHGGPYFKHVGLYAYRPKALIKFVKALPSKLEKIESLEQLRAMEIGLSIHVVEVETANHGIDTPEQLEMARKLLKKL